MILSIEEMLMIEPYSLNSYEKGKVLTKRLIELTEEHISRCPEYASMMRGIGYDANESTSYYDIPFLPVSLFKELELKSISQEDIFKVMTSSGTTGQAVSKIFLDRATAANQQKVLAKIVSQFTGSKRMPMLIIDNPSVIKDRLMFSARGAGILGFSIFGSDKVYALDYDMKVDIPAIKTFLEKHKDERVLLFGFTFMVWLHFYKELLKLDNKFDLSNATLIHGGGWKKLTSEAVSKDEFKHCLKDVCGLLDIHDYYGMVEQTGCIYMECEYGHLHTSEFSDIIVRNHIDFSVCEFGNAGIVQVISTLAESYPGHSLLTEDEGVVLGEDDCRCGRKGKYFHINGRLKMAEIRGCSDTYSTNR
jgi:phenylacetate-coenzyme A ligase PaaK-like adenylate-forming protein